MCCTTGPNVVLTVFDVIRMSKYLNIHWLGFLYDYVKPIIADVIPFLSLKSRGDSCIFINEGDGIIECSIYPARPLRCRLYPLEVISPSVNSLHLDLKCPGVGKGERIKVPIKLVKHFFWELKEHYSMLLRKILEEGRTPLEGLTSVLEELWSKREEEATWTSLEYINSLGAT